MREKHQSAASCTPPAGDVPTTKVHALDWNQIWDLSVCRQTLYPLSQTGFGIILDLHIKLLYDTHLFKDQKYCLADDAQWLECLLKHWRVKDSISSWGHVPGLLVQSLVLIWVCAGSNQSICLSHIDVSLSLCLCLTPPSNIPLSLKVIGENILEWGLTKK